MMKLVFRGDMEFLNSYASMMEEMKNRYDINYDIISATPHGEEYWKVTGLIELSETDHMIYGSEGKYKYNITIPVHSERYGVFNIITYEYVGGHERIYLTYKRDNKQNSTYIEGCSEEQGIELHNLSFELLEKTYRLTRLILPPDILEELTDKFCEHVYPMNFNIPIEEL